MNTLEGEVVSYRPGYRLKRVLSGIRRYFGICRELGIDLLRQFPGETARIIVSSALSLGCQVLALLFLFVYIQTLETSDSLYGFDPRTSLTLFAVVSMTTIVLFFGFVLLEYYSNMVTLDLSRRYQVQGIQEALSLSSKLPQWFAQEGGECVSRRHLRQLISVDAHHRSRMARTVMRTVVPVARLMLTAAALLYLNLEFSVFILVIIGIPILGLYWVGRRIADTMTLREKVSQPPFKEQFKRLSESWESDAHISPDEIDNDLALGKSNSRYWLYFDRLGAKSFGQLLINVANTLGIVVLVLSIGYWVLYEAQGQWSLWITYLIALRYFLSSLHTVAQSVVQSTRYQRQARRFMEFLAAATYAANLPNPKTAPCPEPVLRAYDGDDGDQVEMELDED